MCWLNHNNILIGDILYCYYPFNKSTKQPASEPHYTMVIKVEDIGISLPRRIEVAYGTSKKTDKLYQSELLVDPSKVKSFNKTGLTTKTKFDLENTLVLPYNCEYFLTKNGSTPIVGKLDWSKNEHHIYQQMVNISTYLKSKKI